MSGGLNRPAGLGLGTELALGGVGVVTVLMFLRVFDDRSFLPELLAAVVLPLLIGGVSRRLRLPASATALVSIAVAVLYLSWTLFPSTTAYGIPWKGTATAAREALRTTWDQVPTAVAPVVVTNGYLLLAASGVWGLALAADTLAVSWELPLLGLLPWASLLAVIGAVGVPSGRAAWSLVFLAAAFAYLGVASIDERRRRTRQLHVEGRHAGPPVRGIGITLGTLVLALILTPAVPGFGAAPVVRYKSGIGPGDRVAISPLVDIKFRLEQRPPVNVFSVRAARPLYWRVLALDAFNGQIWGASGRYRQVRGAIPVPRDSSPSRVNRQSYAIEGLAQFWLPAAYAPRTVDASDVRVDPRSLTLATDKETAQGLAYTVESAVPVPSPEELRAVNAPDPLDLAPEIALPRGFPQSIAVEAARLTAEQPSRYDKVIAIQNYLRHFEYSLEPPPGHDEQTMERFLFTDQKGYCEQFAGTMAAMLRSLGIPARVAVGFTPGTLDPSTGIYRVTTENAHAWVEAYFPGYGWLQFEPTPTRNDPNEAAYNGTRTADSDPDSASATPTTRSIDFPAPSTTLPDDSDPLAAGGLPGTPAPRRGVPRWAVLLAIVVDIPLLLGLTILGAKALRRRARLHAPLGQRAQALWAEVLDLLVDAGMPVPGSDTPLETARRAALHLKVPDPPLIALARAEYGEMFAPDGLSETSGLAAHERDVRHAILHRFAPRRRLWVRVSLNSLRRRRRLVAVSERAFVHGALPAFDVP